MKWSEIFPVLNDEMVADYQAEVTPEDRKVLEHHFAVERVVNRREAKHVVATSLFWKPCQQAEADYPPPTKKVMQDPRGHGFSSRFKNPWDHYVLPLLTTARTVKIKRPDLTLRVYLAHDLAFLIDELTAIFPRVAKEGILTLLNRRDVSQTYWFALDIEFCMKANPDSEIMHWGDPWPDEDLNPEFGMFKTRP